MLDVQERVVKPAVLQTVYTYLHVTCQLCQRYAML